VQSIESRILCIYNGWATKHEKKFEEVFSCFNTFDIEDYRAIESRLGVTKWHCSVACM